jgi:hypothetical protein
MARAQYVQDGIACVKLSLMRSIAGEAPLVIKICGVILQDIDLLGEWVSIGGRAEDLG